MVTCRIEELGHTAEVGIRVVANSPSKLYACAARGMFGLLYELTETATPANRRMLVVESMDRESLLVDWLNELLFLHATSGNSYGECEVTQWSPTRLEAVLAEHPTLSPPSMEIKAVTYHLLRVAEVDQEWVAEVYFDI